MLINSLCDVRLNTTTLFAAYFLSFFLILIHYSLSLRLLINVRYELPIVLQIFDVAVKCPGLVSNRPASGHGNSYRSWNARIEAQTCSMAENKIIQWNTLCDCR